MPSSEAMAILFSVFDSEKSEEDLAAALEEAHGNVDLACDILLAPAPATKKRTLTDFFSPAAKRERRTTPDPPEASPPSPASAKPVRNAFDTLLREGSRSGTAAGEPSLPPKVLTAADVSAHLPCEMFVDFLPRELADALLGRLLVDARSWKSRWDVGVGRGRWGLWLSGWTRM
ncbi:hypothetical protein BDK51DRAFT_44033 [Blyttiomyces helicus]|uniref:CUE domain-containing protein n=1 Tax=Blyttiomyces helicus TaxID=388810 RepID=A0A4P9WJ15_9FUNG|nr:hypothetical protein BDK51DRAFT_44033 [Blyttiomyces helicus]|eukprot:RKO92035.1 hypothetical protein BDK51DRAFT_44033 [Blyttiomyces helicus]